MIIIKVCLPSPCLESLQSTPGWVASNPGRRVLKTLEGLFHALGDDSEVPLFYKLTWVTGNGFHKVTYLTPETNGGAQQVLRLSTWNKTTKWDWNRSIVTVISFKLFNSHGDSFCCRVLKKAVQILNKTEVLYGIKWLMPALPFIILNYGLLYSCIGIWQPSIY